jgi:cell division protein FtsI (penicillin-binding protein 3)
VGRRIRVLVAVAVLAMVLLAGRAIFIGTVEAGDLRAKAVGQQRQQLELPAPRGSILTADDQPLALDRPTVMVSATPYLIKDPRETASRLADLLGMKEADLEALLARRTTYVPVARNVDVATGQKIESMRLPGIDLTDTQQRVSPRGRTAAQVVGLTGDEGKGISGLEEELDRALTGRPGLRREAQDPFGRPIQILANRDPVPGRDVELTLDSAIQERAEQVLADTRDQFGAKAAMAVVLRPSDGAILAMATVPRFDPNRRESLSPELERNRPVTDTFEPGSTFKIVTVAGALSQGLVTPDTVFDLPSTLTLYDRTLHEAHRDVDVSWPVKDILARSSNIGTVEIAMRLGKDDLQRWIERFGFGARTGVDFPGEVSGYLRPPSQWYGTGILNIPIGQGDGVTLVQLARAYAAVANGGYLVSPHLVSRVGSSTVRTPRRTRILTPAVARQVNQMLRGVVSPDGTGALASVKGYSVAGKTGTANIYDPSTGEYSSRYNASFVGYVPANHPRLLVAVTVQEPTRGIYGGEVAAPAFERIAAFSLLRLKIPPTG